MPQCCQAEVEASLLTILVFFFCPEHTQLSLLHKLPQGPQRSIAPEDDTPLYEMQFLPWKAYWLFLESKTFPATPLEDNKQVQKKESSCKRSFIFLLLASDKFTSTL